MPKAPVSEATFSVGILRDILHYVAAQGVEMGALCSQAGIDPAWLGDPDGRVSGEVLRRLWRGAVQATGDENLGLHIGEAFDLTALGIVGYVLLNCQTYGDVLEKLSRYTRLFSQGVAIAHQVMGETVSCECRIRGEVSNYLLKEPRHPIESTLAALVRATHQLTGKSLPILGVDFQHEAPRDPSEHERVFGVKVRFSQPTTRIVFAAACLGWPVRSGNPQLLPLLETHAQTLLGQQAPPQTQVERVKQVIREHLQGEVPTVSMIAHQLLTSVRQLQRELNAESTSFQRVLDDTRREIALEQLRDPEVSIHDVAFVLGFSDPSAFHRAFKRWTGATPKSYAQTS